MFRSNTKQTTTNKPNTEVKQDGGREVGHDEVGGGGGGHLC